MKKTLILALAAVLAMTLVPALAAEGDRVLGRGEDWSADSVFALGDALYLNAQGRLMVWNPGDMEAAEVELRYDFSAYDPESRYEAVVTHIPGEDSLWNLTHLMDGENGAIAATLLGRVTIQDGAAALSDLRALEWPGEWIESYDGAAEPIRLTMAWVSKDALCAMDRRRNMIVMDLNTMETRYVNQRNVISFVPYTNHTLLLCSYDMGEDGVKLSVYDPATDRLEALCICPEWGAQGLAADPDTGAVYGLRDGAVCPLNPDTGEIGQTVTGLFLTPADSDLCAWLIGGRYYAVNCEGGVLVCDLQSEVRSTHALKVVDGGWTDALDEAGFAFSQLHGDVTVSIDREGLGDLITDMLNQSADGDIYILNMTDGEFDALFQRGYLAELDSEALDARMANIYPEIRNALTREGKLTALPVNCSLWTLGFSEDALEKLGLPLDDVPDNWMDLLDFLAETLPERLKANPDVRLASEEVSPEDMRRALFDRLFSDYTAYARAEMDAVSYDTELLRALLEKLDRVDFEAMGDGDGDDAVLMSFGMGAAFGSFHPDFTPVILSVDADARAMMAMELEVAVVNPYSDEKALAVEFLETLVSVLNDTVMYSLDPTLNEPVRSSDYEETIEIVRSGYDSLVQALAEADERDRQALEERLRFTEGWMKRVEENDWDISPQRLEWYRAHDDHAVCAGQNWLYSSGDGEAFELVQRYLQGTLDAQSLLKDLDQKIRMMMLEGN